MSLPLEPSNRMAGKVALVSAAAQGIGYATAMAMAEAGADSETLSLSGPVATPEPPPKPNYHQSVAMARNTAVEQPVRAAYVVKNWIAADG